MRKHRSWLMGFGIGLIVGAIMLQMITFAEKQGAPLTEEPMEAERLADEAKRAGLLLLTQEQLDERVRAAVAEDQLAGNSEGAESPEASIEGPDGAAGGSGASADPDGAEAAPAESGTPPAEQGNAASSPETGQEQVSLYISYGMSLTEVGRELQKLGVIDDVKEFIEETRPVAKKMKVGTAVFKGRPTYQEIMDELVRKK
ncbi:hypothetical protein [Cohnella cellulosilytica]|uniref:YceG-like family protein n=1 Tax=Cohnella cellulosilytica TaxID=986710 RepID=A0ABW2FG84_9BACL